MARNINQETDLLNIQLKIFSTTPLRKIRMETIKKKKKGGKKSKLTALHLKQQKFRSKCILNLYLHSSTTNPYPFSLPASNAQWLVLPCPSIMSCYPVLVCTSILVSRVELGITDHPRNILMFVSSPF